MGCTFPFGHAARAEAAEFSAAPVIDQRFGQDAARGIAGTEEQDVERSVIHASCQSSRFMNAELAGQMPENSRVARIASGAESRGAWL